MCVVEGEFIRSKIVGPGMEVSLLAAVYFSRLGGKKPAKKKIHKLKEKINI